MTDDYENIPGRHRFGDDYIPLTQRDCRMLRRTLIGLGAFWLAVVLLIVWLSR
jgi:hypothetical protein